MKANVIFAQVTNNVGFDYENYKYETVKDNMSVLGTWEFDDKKKARRFIYKSLQQLRGKVKGDAPTEMQFLLKDDKFNFQNSQMEDKTTGNAWFDTKAGETFILCRQEIKPEKPEKDERPADEPTKDKIPAPEPPKDETSSEDAPEPTPEPEAKVENIELPAPPAVIELNPIEELFGAVGEEIATSKKQKKNKRNSKK